jgi:predicted phosphodiesterase
MRIAILSDIHGNPIALDAVLADIQTQGKIDSYWVLGDFSAIGYDPVTPLEQMVKLPNARFVRGNTDRYTVTGDLFMNQEKVKENPSLLSQLVEMAQSFAWTRGYLTATGWLGWLANLPLEQRVTLPDGTRLLGVHASPGRDDGAGIQPQHSDAELETLLAGCEADLVIVGHTHIPLDRRVGNVHVINLGSVSNPITPGLQATYVILDADSNDYTVQFRRVDYDRLAVIKAIEQVNHPTSSYLLQFMRGERLIQTDQTG